MQKYCILLVLLNNLNPFEYYEVYIPRWRCSMGITVLKFGGTSLRDIARNSDFLKRIKDTYEREKRLVVVVSAIGRMGEPYATDTLIYQLEKICKEIDPKKKDFIMSCGETISAAIVSHLLESEGLSSEPLMGFQAGILTDNTFTASKILQININKILSLLDEEKIVVVTGFQGITKEMEITTLGRGGSDTTAVALGAYLDADIVDIYTDVPGVALIDLELSHIQDILIKYLILICIIPLPMVLPQLYQD